MKDSFRQSMAWLHTWVGLLPGWVLFLVFLFGSTAFFQQEISSWMRPEVTSGPVSARALDAASGLLQNRATAADSWSLSLPGPRGGDGLSVSWIPQGQDWSKRQEAKLNPATGREIAIRETRGGEFLYRFHFELHYVPWWVGRYVVSIAALAMLVAILSGIVTHKKIFADFFLLRFGKGQRSWLDAHNVTAVLALPFYLMITYTGLVTLLFTLMPWAISASFPSEDAFYEAAYPRTPDIPVSGKAATVQPFSMLAGQAAAIWQGERPSFIEVNHPGDSSAVATLYPARNKWGEKGDPLYLDAVTGKNLRKAVPHEGGARATQDVMVDLHTGWFAGSAVRWLYFLSGVGGTVMVGSGLVLWTVKRRTKLPDPASPHFGFRLVERLNIGVIAGAPAGIAVYFLANRLLPPGLEGRADWEINGLFIAWGALFAWTLGRSARRAWTEALAACAILYTLVPVVSALTTTRGLIPGLIARDWVFVGFDLAMLATASAFALAARKAATHKQKALPRRRARTMVEANA